MSYTKTQWRNNQSPAINADNLNHIEQGVYDAHQDIAENTQNIESLTTQTGANTSAIALEKTERQQAVTSAIALEKTERQQAVTAETLARESTDNNLQAQIDQLVAPSGTAPNPAEIENARIGADGVTYDTLGNAIRTQVTNLKSDYKNLNEFSRKNIEHLFNDTGSVTQGIDANVFLDVDIPANTPFDVLFTTDEGLFTNDSVNALYLLNANGNAIQTKYWAVANTKYTFTANETVKKIKIYTASSRVLASGSVTLNAQYIQTVDGSLEERIDNLEFLKNVVDADVKFYSKLYEIGADYNNDGNATYIYKNIADFAVSDKDVIGVYCEAITNFANNPVYVYFYNNNTLLQDVAISSKYVLEGESLRIPSGTTRVLVRLYPSTSGGLVDEYAQYYNVLIFTSADGYLRTKKSSQETALVVPAYYFKNDYLQNKISAIRTLMEDANGNYDAFIFCTDQHWTLNAKQSPKLIKYISDQLNIKRLFMGGDYADGINVDAYNAFKQAFLGGNIYNVAGNHEYMNYFANEHGEPISHTVTGATIWVYLNGGLMDANIGLPMRNYYYVDNPVQKMRYIILNNFTGSPAYLFEQEQIDWFNGVMSNLPLDYIAVVFIHAISGVDHVTGELTEYYAFNEIQSVVDNYVGKVAGVFGGHTHFDGLGSTDGNIPVFVTTCDKYLPLVGDDDYLTDIRTLGTITEQAFDVVVIDKTNRKVSAVRIGCPANNPSGSPLEIRQMDY